MSSSSYFKSILFTIMVLFLASCATKKSSVADKNKSIRVDIVDYSKKYLNKPYQYGGRGPNAFDCSGYTSFIFSKFGFRLEDSSAGQARQGITIKRKEELEIGDLVFFEGRSRNGRVGHVGIVSDIGRRGQFKFIHASTTNGVIITSSHEPYYQDRYLRGGRIIKDIPKPKVVEKQEHAEQYNYAKAQDSIVYKETDEGFIAINSNTGKPLEGEPVVSTEQTSKPVKSKKPEDNKKKKSAEIRQAAIRGSEESLIIPPNRITHKVKPGETLYSISQTHNCSVDHLKKWNPNIVNNVIQAGDELDIYQ
jgi:LysM repeat protein